MLTDSQGPDQADTSRTINLLMFAYVLKGHFVPHTTAYKGGFGSFCNCLIGRKLI